MHFPTVLLSIVWWFGYPCWSLQYSSLLILSSKVLVLSSISFTWSQYWLFFITNNWNLSIISIPSIAFFLHLPHLHSSSFLCGLELTLQLCLKVFNPNAIPLPLTAFLICLSSLSSTTLLLSLSCPSHQLICPTWLSWYCLGKTPTTVRLNSAYSVSPFAKLNRVNETMPSYHWVLP